MEHNHQNLSFDAVRVEAPALPHPQEQIQPLSLAPAGFLVIFGPKKHYPAASHANPEAGGKI